MKLTPMQRYEEQQRLKLMSKKIASAKSILRKENIIGQPWRGKGGVPPSQHDDNFYQITPMQSDDSGQIVMRKVLVRKRPEWQDVNHTDYKSGGRVAPRPQYIERRKPHRISVRTPESARDVLAKELQRAEALFKRDKGSPQAAECNEELANIRKSLSSSKQARALGSGGSARSGGVVEPAVGSDDVQDLVSSIDALSSVLDSKLALISEEGAQPLAGTASSFVLGATYKPQAGAPGNPAHSSQQVQSQLLNALLPSELAAAAAPCGDDDPVVRTGLVHVLDEDGDVCLHSDSMEDGDDAREEAEGDECYDDDFETSLNGPLGGGVVEGEEASVVPEDVVDKLNATHSKIDLLERLLTPQKQGESDGGDQVHGAEEVRPAQEQERRQPEAAPAPVTQPPEAQWPAAPVSRIASKPFSFKTKAGAGGSGPGNGKGFSLFAPNGPTLLNDSHKPTAVMNKPVEPHPTDSGKAMLPEEHKLDKRNATHRLPEERECALPVGGIATLRSDPALACAPTLPQPGIATLRSDPASAHSAAAASVPSVNGEAEGANIAGPTQSRDSSGHVAQTQEGAWQRSHAPMGQRQGGGSAEDSERGMGGGGAQGTSSGGHGRRGVLNFSNNSDGEVGVAAAYGDGEAAAAAAFQPPGGRRGRGRGLLNPAAEGHVGGGPEVARVGESEAGVGAGAGAGAGQDAGSWAGSVCGDALGTGAGMAPMDGGGAGESRATSATGRRKITKEDIRRAMQEGAGGCNVAAAVAGPVDTHACHQPVGRRQGGHSPLSEDAGVFGGLAGRERERGRDGGGGCGPGSWGREDVVAGATDGEEAVPRSLVSGRRGPVRATGPPRFVAGIGAEARAAAAAVQVEHGMRARPNVARVSDSMEGIGALVGGGEAGGVGGADRGSGSESALCRRVAGVGLALDSSLDRSLECEML